MVWSTVLAHGVVYRNDRGGVASVCIRKQCAAPFCSHCDTENKCRRPVLVLRTSVTCVSTSANTPIRRVSREECTVLTKVELFDAGFHVAVWIGNISIVQPICFVFCRSSCLALRPISFRIPFR